LDAGEVCPPHAAAIVDRQSFHQSQAVRRITILFVIRGKTKPWAHVPVSGRLQNNLFTCGEKGSRYYLDLPVDVGVGAGIKARGY